MGSNYTKYGDQAEEVEEIMESPWWFIPAFVCAMFISVGPMAVAFVLFILVSVVSIVIALIASLLTIYFGGIGNIVVGIPLLILICICGLLLLSTTPWTACCITLNWFAFLRKAKVIQKKRILKAGYTLNRGAIDVYSKENVDIWDYILFFRAKEKTPEDAEKV